MAELQAQLDELMAYYDEVRPHTARGRLTPRAAWEAKAKAVPDKANLKLSVHTRVRHDKVDCTGVFTLRHNTRLHHIGVGRAHKGRRVIILVADLDIRVLSQDGELLPPHPRSSPGLPTHRKGLNHEALWVQLSTIPRGHHSPAE
jgi:hypothetical protein